MNYVDFIPNLVSNDFKKIRDDGNIDANEIIVKVSNQLNLHRGTLDDFIGVGCKDELLKLLFSEDMEKYVEDELKHNLQSYNKNDIEVSVTKRENKTGDVVADISIGINDVPSIQFDAVVKNKGNSVLIIEPIKLENFNE